MDQKYQYVRRVILKAAESSSQNVLTFLMALGSKDVEATEAFKDALLRLALDEGIDIEETYFETLKIYVTRLIQRAATISSLTV